MIHATDVLAAAMHAATDQAARKPESKPSYWKNLSPEQQKAGRKAAAFLVSYVGTGSIARLEPAKVTEALARAGHSVTVEATVAALQLMPTVSADAH